MKKIFFTICTILALATTSYANDFEGKIIQTYFDRFTDRMLILEWSIKNDNTKLVMKYEDEELTFLSNNGSVILITENQVTLDGQSFYVRIPNAEIKEAEKTNVNFIVLDETVEQNDVKIELGGDVNGHVAYNEDISTDVVKAFPFMNGSYEFLILSRQNIDGFPISAQLKDKNGILVSYIQTTSIVEEKLTAEEFAIPADMVDADALNE